MFLGPVQPLATPPSVFSLRFNHICGSMLNSSVAHGKQIQMFVYGTFFGPQSVFCADFRASTSASPVRDLHVCAWTRFRVVLTKTATSVHACEKGTRKQKHVFFHVLLPRSTQAKAGAQSDYFAVCCFLYSCQNDFANRAPPTAPLRTDNTIHSPSRVSEE